MPRVRLGVHQMRVDEGDQVYILQHRLPFVAWRTHRWSQSGRVAALERLQAQDAHNHQYIAAFKLHTRVTGLISLTDAAGRVYTAHHSDVVRV